jgi:hypothetical protein
VFNIVVGAVIAVVLFGLPLAIIGLFIVSVLDLRNARPDQNTKTLPKAAGSEVDHSRANWRPIIYGQHPSVATASGDSSKGHTDRGASGSLKRDRADAPPLRPQA